MQAVSFAAPVSSSTCGVLIFWKETGNGIHHIMISPENPKSVLENFRSAGIPEVTPGTHNGMELNALTGYFDMHDLNMIFEIRAEEGADAMTTMDFDTLFIAWNSGENEK